MTAPADTVRTIEELVGPLRELAEQTASHLEDQVSDARKRPHTGPCGEHRHDHIHTSGYLLGLCSALAMATGEDSTTIYHRMVGATG